MQRNQQNTELINVINVPQTSESAKRKTKRTMIEVGYPLQLLKQYKPQFTGEWMSVAFCFFDYYNRSILITPFPCLFLAKPRSLSYVKAKTEV